MELSDGMDIAACSMMNAQVQAMQTVSIEVLAKTMDTFEMAGEKMIQLMEQSVNPELGTSIDIKV